MLRTAGRALPENPAGWCTGPLHPRAAARPLVALLLIFAPDDAKTFESFLGVTATPQGFLLPVLGVLLAVVSVASEARADEAVYQFRTEEDPANPPDLAVCAGAPEGKEAICGLCLPHAYKGTASVLHRSRPMCRG